MSNDMTKTAGTGLENTRQRALYRPLADIYETEGGVFVVVELPGVAAESVEVTLEKRVLTIRGRLPETPRSGYRQVHAEYGEGDFERAFTLSEDVDQDRMSADYRLGVLTLELPKAAPAKPKKIQVRTA